MLIEKNQLLKLFDADGNLGNFLESKSEYELVQINNFLDQIASELKNKSYQLKFLKELYNQKKYKLVYKCLEKTQFYNYDHAYLYLETLSNLGEVKLLKEKAIYYLELLLIQKKYPAFLKHLKYLEQKKLHLEKISLARLTYYQETNQQDLIVAEIDRIVQNGDYTIQEKALNILDPEMAEGNITFYKALKKLEMLCSKRIELSEHLKILLVAHGESDLLRLQVDYSNLSPEVNSGIVQYLKEKFQVEIEKKNSVLVNRVKLVNNESDNTNVDLSEFNDITSNANINLSLSYNYQDSVEEKLVLEGIDFKDKSDQELISLFASFRFMEFHRVCHKIAEYMLDDERRTYYLALALFNMNRYEDAELLLGTLDSSAEEVLRLQSECREKNK